MEAIKKNARRFKLGLEYIYGTILIAIILFFIKLSIPYYKIWYSISHLETRFFNIEVSKSGPIYTETKILPSSWVPIEKISKKAIGAIVVSEDGKFYYHHGYDIEQIQKVMALKFLAKKKHVRGASTITQQLIKNIYLTKEKSISRKITELYFANFIEDKTSKQKILETYLNVIEYGKGIYGIENAAKYYFHKKAQNLNAKEGAFLAMLLPSPVKYSKSFTKKMLTPFASSIIESVLLKMKMSNYISESEYIAAQKTPLSFEKMSEVDRESMILEFNEQNAADE